jgi:hypothetical protein
MINKMLKSILHHIRRYYLLKLKCKKIYIAYSSIILSITTCFIAKRIFDKWTCCKVSMGSTRVQNFLHYFVSIKNLSFKRKENNNSVK